MIDNRQSGRRRGRGGQRPQGNPGRPGGGGNRIDNRARGNAQQLHEKYKNLARDSQMAGDRVTTEYYLQFADHYFRVLSESRARFEDQRPQHGNSDDEFDGEDGGKEKGSSDQAHHDILWVAWPERLHSAVDRRHADAANSRSRFPPKIASWASGLAPRSVTIARCSS